MIENLVFETTQNLLATHADISNLADKILLLYNQRIDDVSALNLLNQQYDEINHSIENILNAMEKGITTTATK